MQKNKVVLKTSPQNIKVNFRTKQRKLIPTFPLQKICKDAEMKINDREYIPVETLPWFLCRSKLARRRVKKSVQKLLERHEVVCPWGEPLPYTSEGQKPIKGIPTNVKSKIVAPVCLCLQFSRWCQERGIQLQTCPVPPSPLTPRNTLPVTF